MKPKGIPDTKAAEPRRSFPVLLLCLVAIASPLVVLPPLDDYANLPQTLFIDIIAFVLLAAACHRALRDGSANLPSVPICAAITLFIVYCFCSTLWAVNHAEGVPTAIHWAMCACIYLVTVASLSGVESARRLFSAVAAAGAAVSGIGLMQQFVGFDLIPQAMPPAATFANKNVAAEFAAMSLPAAALVFAMAGTRAAAVLSMSGISVMLCFLAAAGTRAALLAVAAEAVVWAAGAFAIHRRRRQPSDAVSFNPPRLKTAVLLVGALVAAAVTFHAVSPWGGKTSSPLRIVSATFEDLFDYWNDNGQPPQTSTRPTKSKVVKTKTEVPEPSSVAIRLSAWLNASGIFLDNPAFGVGLGNLKIHYPLYHRKYAVEAFTGEKWLMMDIHNDWLQLLVELGATGFLLAAMLLFLLIRSLTLPIFGRTANDAPSEVAHVCLAVLAMMAGYAVIAFFQFPSERALPLFLMALGLGAASALSGSRKIIFRTPASPAAFYILGAVSATIFMLIADMACRQLMADRHFHLLRKATVAKDHRTAVKEASEVLRLDSRRAFAYSYMGRSYGELGMGTESMDALSALLERFPNHFPALVNLGIAKARQRRFDEAAALYDRALRIDPDSALLRNNRGSLLMEAGETAKSIPEFEKATALAPANAAYRRNLASAYRQAGRRGDADREQATAARLEKTN